MPRALGDDLTARLHRLAIDFVLPTGASTTDAVVLAEDLLAAGDDTPATVAVAALSRRAIRSDAEDEVRQMLAEHDLVVSVVAGADDEYRMLLKAFAYWSLPAHQFIGAFCTHLPDWDEQTPLDRKLGLLLDRRDSDGWSAARQVIEEEMRAAARTSLASTTPD